jgi:hypothetical protein
MCSKANEAVVIAFTPVAQEAKPFMVPMNSWIDPKLDYTWWLLSKGLFELVFANLGFNTQFHIARAVTRIGELKEAERFTIVARRIHSRDDNRPSMHRPQAKP